MAAVLCGTAVFNAIGVGTKQSFAEEGPPQILESEVVFNMAAGLGELDIPVSECADFNSSTVIIGTDKVESCYSDEGVITVPVSEIATLGVGIHDITIVVGEITLKTNLNVKNIVDLQLGDTQIYEYNAHDGANGVVSIDLVDITEELDTSEEFSEVDSTEDGYEFTDVTTSNVITATINGSTLSATLNKGTISVDYGQFIGLPVGGYDLKFVTADGATFTTVLRISDFVTIPSLVCSQYTIDLLSLPTNGISIDLLDGKNEYEVGDMTVVLNGQPLVEKVSGLSAVVPSERLSALTTGNYTIEIITDVCTLRAALTVIDNSAPASVDASCKFDKHSPKDVSLNIGIGTGTKKVKKVSSVHVGGSAVRFDYVETHLGIPASALKNLKVGVYPVEISINTGKLNSVLTIVDSKPVVTKKPAVIKKPIATKAPAVKKVKKDTKDPTVSGVTNGKTYKKSVTIKVTDASGIKSIELNNKKFTTGSKVSKKGSYTLEAVDKIGNKKTVKFKIK